MLRHLRAVANLLLHGDPDPVGTATRELRLRVAGLEGQVATLTDRLRLAEARVGELYVSAAVIERLGDR